MYATVLGSYLSVLIGAGFPTLAPIELMESLESVSVQQADRGRNGFQMTFAAGRSGASGALDYPPLIRGLARPGNRVILIVSHAGRPNVVMDGIIASVQLSPSPDPAASKITVTGHDISVLMDLVELKMPLPCPTTYSAINLVLAMFSAVMAPVVIPPITDLPQTPLEQTPTLSGTPYAFVNGRASRHGYVFHVRNTPVPGANIGYWGPPVPEPVLQPALTFKMGAATNVGSIQFTNDASGPTFIYGMVHQEDAPVPVPIAGIPAPPIMAAVPAYAGSLPYLHVRRLSDDRGGSIPRAIGKASAEMFEANHGAVKASGELDVAQYGHVLKAREFVGVRGVGLTFDGVWYVSSVSHTITRGSYKQSFELQRDGTISNVPAVLA